MDDAMQFGLVVSVEEEVQALITQAEQSEVAHLRAENERLRQSNAVKDEENQQLKNELEVERQQKMFWIETIRRDAHSHLDMCATADPKIWEQRLTDYLAKVSCSSATGLSHAGLSGRGHQEVSIVHSCFERLENHR